MPFPTAAEQRHLRRHGDNEWALWLILIPKVFHARHLQQAEDLMLAFLRRHRKRFWWCVESDALTVLRQTVWPDRLAENQF